MESVRKRCVRKEFLKLEMLREAAKQTIKDAAAIPEHTFPVLQEHTAGRFLNNVPVCRLRGDRVGRDGAFSLYLRGF